MTLDAEAVACWMAIRVLTDRPGSSVTVTAAGLDYTLAPCASVICHGAWTPREGRSFTGADPLEALSCAVIAYTAKTRGEAA